MGVPLRVSLKLFVPVLLAVIAVSLLFSSYQVRRDRRIQERDLSRRAELLADSLEESVTPLLGSRQRIAAAGGALRQPRDVWRGSPCTTTAGARWR